MIFKKSVKFIELRELIIFYESTGGSIASAKVYRPLVSLGAFNLI
jgi:hypothetical protein